MADDPPADDSVTKGTNGSIGNWYIEDAGGESDVEDIEIDPDNLSSTESNYARLFKIITVFRDVVNPSAFNSQESITPLSSLPTFYVSPTQTCTVDLGGKKARLRSDRLIRDSQIVGQYRQLRRYETTGAWDEETTSNGCAQSKRKGL
jgi:hypothetical protein